MLKTIAVLLITCANARAATITLTGNWAGTWTDSRTEYSKSGGDFTCAAVEKEPGVWSATFNVGKEKVFKVELTGKMVDGRIVFEAPVSLGKFYGVYAFKGYLTQDSFLGEYDAPDEKGTFKMTRAAAETKAAAGSKSANAP